jgi:23S rRNA-/tRNA-specific pseudouridylate synthase
LGCILSTENGLRALLAYELANRGQLSIITRLDRETSGLVLLALTLERARPRTGRTRQIRVHLAQAGYPLVGYKIYGGREGAAYLEFIETGWTPKLAGELLLPRHALHAVGLEFRDENGPRRVEGMMAGDLRDFGLGG